MEVHERLFQGQSLLSDLFRDVLRDERFRVQFDYALLCFLEFALGQVKLEALFRLRHRDELAPNLLVLLVSLTKLVLLCRKLFPDGVKLALRLSQAAHLVFPGIDLLT